MLPSVDDFAFANRLRVVLPAGERTWPDHVPATVFVFRLYAEGEGVGPGAVLPPDQGRDRQLVLAVDDLVDAADECVPSSTSKDN